MGGFDQELMRVAARQHWVASREQLFEIGTSKQIQHRLRTNVLDAPNRAVYRLTASPDTWKQRLMSATLAGGRFSVASFRASFALWELPGGDELTEITCVRHRRARYDGVITHESRRLHERDIAYIDNIPVTRPARTIVDMGLLVETGEVEASVLEHAMHEAVRRELVDATTVRREWERLGRSLRPGGRAVEAMLRRFVPPLRRPDSRPELRLLQIIRAAGLPEPMPQHRVWISPVRWYDLDFAWPHLLRYFEFDPYKWHGNRDKYIRDSNRRLELQARGWLGVSITDDELDDGAELAVAAIRSLLTEASLDTA